MIFSDNIQMMIDNVELSEIKPRKTTTNYKNQFNPSLSGGYGLLYENTVPTDLRYIDYDRNTKHVGSSQRMVFRILGFGFKPNISKIKVQIQSQNDPFFNVVFQCDENKFSIMKNQQKLKNQFQQLPTIIIKCLNRIEQAINKLNVGLLVSSDGKTKLTFTQTSEFKNIQILTLDLNQSSQEELQKKISNKYQSLLKKISQTEQRLFKINQIISEKNPSLLLQIQKSTHK